MARFDSDVAIDRCDSNGVSPSRQPHLQVSPTWSILQVRTRKEASVLHLLRLRGLDPYLPTYRQKVRWSDRTKVVERVLFPGYLFVQLGEHIDPAEVTLMRGVIRWLHDGPALARLDDSEIERIRTLAHAPELASPHPYIIEGDMVRIETGPFAGVEGTLVKSKDGLRVVVGVELLHRAVAVEMDREAITPLGAHTRRGEMLLAA